MGVHANCGQGKGVDGNDGKSLAAVKGSDKFKDAAKR
jgi:hypothetical protein